MKNVREATEQEQNEKLNLVDIIEKKDLKTIRCKFFFQLLKGSHF